MTYIDKAYPTMQDDYPEFDDPETCSWCTNVVEDADLNDLDDGARVCDTCYVIEVLIAPVLWK